MSSHKIELAIQDVSESSDLNNECNTDFVNIFFLFEKANMSDQEISAG